MKPGFRRANLELTQDELPGATAPTIGTSAAGGVTRAELFRAHCLERFARAGLLQVAISWEHLNAGWSGTFRVAAILKWSGGGVQHEVTFDVPARGAIACVGASSSLSVEVQAEGASADASARVTGSVAIVDATHPRPVYRTIETTLPGSSGVIQAIPQWATKLHMATSDLTGSSGATIELLDARSGAPATVAEIDLTPGDSHPVPAPADAFRVIGPAKAGTVATIWELAI